MNDNKLKSAIERQDHFIKLYNAIIPVIEKYTDKTVTKRLASEIEKLPQLQGYTVYYNPNEYNLHRTIAIWGNGLNYDNKLYIHFSFPSEIMRCKTEKAVIEDTITSLKAQLENAIASQAQLQEEYMCYSMIVEDYKKKEEAIKELNNEFVDKWGTTNNYGEKSLSYTMREILDNK